MFVILNGQRRNEHRKGDHECERHVRVVEAGDCAVEIALPSIRRVVEVQLEADLLVDESPHARAIVPRVLLGDLRRTTRVTRK